MLTSHRKNITFSDDVQTTDLIDKLSPAAGRQVKAKGTGTRSMKALEPESLSSIISDVYDCAFDPDRWQLALTRINEAVNGAYTTISLSDPQFLMPRMAAHSPWDPVMLKVLNEEYGVAGVPGLKEVAFGDLDTPLSTLDQMSEEAFQASRFYQEWVQPQGLRDGCVMKFAQTSDRMGLIAFITRDTRDIVTADERRFMAALSPHVRRAAMIGDLLNYERVQTQHFRQALDRVAAAVFLVDATGRILHANGQADAMLTAEAHVMSAGGVLTTSNPLMASALSDAISRTTGASSDLGGRGIGIPVSVAGQLPAMAYVLPLRASATRASFSPAVAAVFIASRVTAVPPAQDVLATLYDLTPSEARVMLKIGEGIGLGPTADALGISENTAKTHLTRIFGKTRTSRQTEIVSIVAALSPPVALD
jgi:DNA-binding CsgD family transcriptional regulator/PAS domain-containing protein